MSTSLAEIQSIVTILSGGLKSGKVEAFLFSALKPKSLPLYIQALKDFKTEIATRPIPWHRLDESQKDYVIAEYCIEYRESKPQSSPNAMAVYH